MSAAPAHSLGGTRQFGLARRLLVWLGASVRVRASIALMLAALCAGVVAEAVRPRSWRRTVRTEFRRILRYALGGGLLTTVFAAALIGLGMVYQALYWLGIAGQEEQIGTILVTVLVREVTPVLVGFILLGRSGAVVLTELGHLRAAGEIHALQAQGIDPFLVLVMPRGVAFAVSAYTLGMVFIVTALFVGFVAGSLLGAVQLSIWTFLDHLLTAMRPTDFAIFPVKLLVIGLLVAGTSCLTALAAGAGDDPAKLMPRGFVRGMLAIMLASGLLSMVA